MLKTSRNIKVKEVADSKINVGPADVERYAFQYVRQTRRQKRVPHQPDSLADVRNQSVRKLRRFGFRDGSKSQIRENHRKFTASQRPRFHRGSLAFRHDHAA